MHGRGLMKRMRSRSRSPGRNKDSNRYDRKRNENQGQGNAGNGVPPISPPPAPPHPPNNNFHPMNNMMMMNMYPPGNMMMPGGMFPNMMMPDPMMEGPGMDMMTQANMNMGPNMMPAGSGMEMNMVPMMDPSMMAMGMYGNNMGINNMPNSMKSTQPKTEIVLKNCTLVPPSNSFVSPQLRPKPPGCKTIFVKGLPDNATEEIVSEVFGNYGPIQSLRLSKKNYCHIRYEMENSVDSAIELNGYLLKVTKTNEGENSLGESNTSCGWLMVDFAKSRDDQSDYERKQRQLEREKRESNHYNSYNESRSSFPRRNRSPSPAKVPPFATIMLLQVNEKIKSDEHFAEALPILISWLERGECCKRNASQFYSMIQTMNSHTRRLINEKQQAEEELQVFKDKITMNIRKVTEQIEKVALVFGAAMHQRVSDHFTKGQRKNIESWHKMAQETIEDAMKEEFNEKCDLNDDKYILRTTSDEEVGKLEKQNESLKFQLEAYKNEVDVIKTESQRELEKFKAEFIVQQELKSKIIPQSPVQQQPPAQQSVTLPAPPVKTLPVSAGCGEAKLIGVMSAFLMVHPQGASLDYLVSYIRALFPDKTQSEIHDVLQKHTDVFVNNITGVGMNIENRWSFIGYK